MENDSSYRDWDEEATVRRARQERQWFYQRVEAMITRYCHCGVSNSRIFSGVAYAGV